LLSHPFILEESQINYEVLPNFNLEEFKRSSSEKSCIVYNNSTNHKSQEKDKDSENKNHIVEPQDIQIDENITNLRSTKTIKEDFDVGENTISIKQRKFIK
jgi:hypothetical protein